MRQQGGDRHQAYYQYILPNLARPLMPDAPRDKHLFLRVVIGEAPPLDKADLARMTISFSWRSVEAMMQAEELE